MPLSKSKIAFLTCKDHPLCTPDDQLVRPAMNDLDMSLIPLIWDEVSLLELNKYSAVIMRSAWDYQYKSQNFQKFLSDLKNLQMPILNSPDLMLWDMDKNYLLELERQSISIIPSKKMPKNMSAEFWQEEISKLNWDKFVIKPLISGSAYNTFLTDKTDAIKRKSQWQALSHDCDFFIQEYCSSIESLGEISLIYFKNPKSFVFSHAVQKLPQKNDFRVQEHVGGTARAFQADSSCIEFGKNILKNISHDWLYARVDVLFHNNQWVLGELEMIEPQLFFSLDSEAPKKFAKTLKSYLNSTF